MKAKREICASCNRPIPKPRRKKSDPTPLELLGRAVTLFAGFAGDWSPMPLRAAEPYASWGNLPGVEWQRRYAALLAAGPATFFAAVSDVAASNMKAAA